MPELSEQTGAQQHKKQWHDLIAVNELEAEWMVTANLGRRRFVVYQVQGEIYITSPKCTHAAAELSDGYLQDYLVECPWHQGCFDIRTGEALYAPATRPLRCYQSRVVDGVVQIWL